MSALWAISLRPIFCQSVHYANLLKSPHRFGCRQMTNLHMNAMRATTWAIAWVILIGAAISGPSAALAQEPGFFDRIFGNSDRATPTPQDRDIEDRGERPAVAQNRGVQGGDSTMRIDRLEAQIRQLTGAIEQLQHRNQQLEAQLRRVLDEAENRPADGRVAGARPVPGRPTASPSTGSLPAASLPAGSQPAGSQPAAAMSPVASLPTAQPSAAVPQVAASQLAAPQPPPASTGATAGRRGDAFDPSQNPGAPGSPRPIGTTVPSAPLQPFPGGDEPVGAPGGRTAGAPLDLSALVASTIGPASGSAPGSGRGGDQPPPARAPAAPGTQVATLPPSENARDHYDFAYGHVLRKDYAAAEDGFRHFLGKFPSDRLAPEAQYWLGESLFQRQRYRDAAETFLTVSTKHESTSRAPDALLRLGQSLAALGEREAACASFGEVLRKYPRAPASVKQGVDREQKRVRC